MQYRILSDGDSVIVEVKKKGLWKSQWKPVGQNWGYLVINKDFETAKKAEEWCKKEWGNSGKRIREYRII
jgi:hypothetical protein